MADVAVEKTETPVVEKETVEEKPAESLKKVDAPAEAVAENGNDEEQPAKEAEAAKENGDAENVDGVEAEDDTTNGAKKDEEDEEEANGDSTDAPAETVKRKVVEADAKEDAASPEKKAKLDDSKEVESNGADATEVAA